MKEPKEIWVTPVRENNWTKGYYYVNAIRNKSEPIEIKSDISIDAVVRHWALNYLDFNVTTIGVTGL